MDCSIVEDSLTPCEAPEGSAAPLQSGAFQRAIAHVVQSLSLLQTARLANIHFPALRREVGGYRQDSGPAARARRPGRLEKTGSVTAPLPETPDRGKSGPVTVLRHVAPVRRISPMGCGVSGNLLDVGGRRDDSTEGGRRSRRGWSIGRGFPWSRSPATTAPTTRIIASHF